MNLNSRKQRLIAEINITPFTDVILVLLIIFMVTTPLIIQSGIKVNLPGATSARSLKNAPLQANITVTNENLLYLDDKLVTKRELRERILVMHKENPDLAVILVADRLTRYKDIVSVLDILNGAGVNNLDIMTKSE